MTAQKRLFLEVPEAALATAVSSPSAVASMNVTADMAPLCFRIGKACGEGRELSPAGVPPRRIEQDCDVSVRKNLLEAAAAEIVAAASVVPRTSSVAGHTCSRCFEECRSLQEDYFHSRLTRRR